MGAGLILTDGVVTLRPPERADTATLVATRDEQFRRFMGEGSDDPDPTACIVTGGDVVGWVDYDRDERPWLTHDQVNIGYGLHADARGRGYATRAVRLLVSHVARTTDVQVATLLIDPANRWSLGVAARTGFGIPADLDGQRFFTRPVPPLRYTDGAVTIRTLREGDAADDLAATDDEQIRWLWEPWQAARWAAMTPEERLEHKRGNMRSNVEAFATGPKWSFAIEAGGAYAGYVDCDLANEHVPHGEANISYSSHPAHRGKGHVSAAVRLVLEFVRDHTGAREAHILADPDNTASLRVARAVGAAEVGRDRFVHHVISLR